MTDRNKEFPLLQNHPDLVYLDSAATALKPGVVIEAEREYYTHFGTNAARGLYPLAEQTSQHIEDTRATIASFIQGEPENVLFTSSTTAAINMLAHSLEESTSDTSGEVLVSLDAHHSQIIPWQQMAKRKGWDSKIIPVTPEGFLEDAALLSEITPRTKVVALTLVSNVYGVINDIAPLVEAIRTKNPDVFIVVDAAQAVAHIPLNVTTLGVDALIFSGHKLYGPTGVGVCYLVKKWQEKLSPSNFGGGMVADTSLEAPTWKESPEKFEAGTLPLAQIFGLKKAVEYIQVTGFENIIRHEQELVTYSFQKLVTAFGRHITFLGTEDSQKKIGLISFTLEGVHPHDIATLLGEKNICVRAGEHCASFLHRGHNIPATTRISFGLYTTKSDIDTFVSALQELYSFLRK